MTCRPVVPLPLTATFPVVGVTAGDRQRTVAQMRPWDRVVFTCDVTNARDVTAVAVRTTDNVVIGAVPPKLATRVAAYGDCVAGTVVEVLGTERVGLRVQLDIDSDCVAATANPVLMVTSPSGVVLGEFVSEHDGFVRVNFGTSSIRLPRAHVIIVDAEPSDD